jgi:hypothetical protein
MQVQGPLEIRPSVPTARIDFPERNYEQFVAVNPFGYESPFGEVLGHSHKLFEFGDGVCSMIRARETCTPGSPPASPTAAWRTRSAFSGSCPASLTSPAYRRTTFIARAELRGLLRVRGPLLSVPSTTLLMTPGSWRTPHPLCYSTTAGTSSS